MDGFIEEEGIVSEQLKLPRPSWPRNDSDVDCSGHLVDGGCQLGWLTRDVIQGLRWLMVMLTWGLRWLTVMTNCRITVLNFVSLTKSCSQTLRIFCESTLHAASWNN